MAKAAHYIPDRAHAVTPYLVVRDGQGAIAWYRKVFGAEVESVMDGPDGAVMHAELRLGPAQIYLAQEFPGAASEAGFLAPKTLGGTTATIHLYVRDIDAVHARAIENGARELRAPTNEFWGDRHSSIIDPEGHRWGIATHVEDLTEEELEARARQAAEEFAAGQEGG